MLHVLGCAPVVISTIHNVYEGGWQRTLAYKITDRFSLHTTAVSEAVANRFIQIGAAPQGKCSVITNGIDLAEFTPAPNRRTTLRSQLSAGDSFVWLAAGRVVPAKDYSESSTRLRRCERFASPHAQLWMAGEAHAAQAKLMRDLSEQPWDL